MNKETIFTICGWSIFIILILVFAIIQANNMTKAQDIATKFCIDKGYEKIDKGTQTYYACIKYTDDTKYRKDIVCEDDKCYFYEMK